MFGAIGKAVGSFFGGPLGGAAGDLLGGLLDQQQGAQGAKDQNEESAWQAKLQRDFNSAEAAKQREWQEKMRSTGYQTAMADLKAAGLNPMLAYSQGPAAMPTGATASANTLPQVSNKVQAALSANATAAQIANTNASTEKTKADTAVSNATAKQVEAQTALTTNSAENMKQTIERTTAEIDKTKQEVYLVRQQTSESTQRQVLIQYQTDLVKIEQDLAKGKITLQQAQTALTQIQTKLHQYELAGARNMSDSNETWYGRNIRPYIQDAGRITNSATSIYQLRR